MSSQLPFQIENKYQAHFRTDPEPKSVEAHALKHEQSESSLKGRRSASSRRTANATKSQPSPKSSRLNCMYAPPDDAGEHNREDWDNKALSTGGISTCGTKMSDIIQRRCKNVISKLQRRIDKEGHQIVPLLTDLWKRIESTSHTSGSGNNLLDLRKIDHRVDRSEYNGVMELVFDVQFMLKSAMSFYGFSHEVRSEARKVHDLFFDILKIAFPDTDFRESRSALSFSSPVSTSSGPPPRAMGVGLSKRHKLMNEVEPEAQKSLQREDSSSRVRGVHMKESKFGGSSREQQYQRENSPLHPGELVVCKKKRKDREKSMVKTPRTSSTGPVSPPSMGRGIRSPGSVQRETRQSAATQQQQGWASQAQGQPMNGGGLGWANPVKRLRTDAGKRRPSHL